MKSSLLFFCLFICSYSFSQVIDIPDSVFKNRLISESVDSNNNGEIEQSEALNVTVLGVQSTLNDPDEILTLEGIQYFTNLIEFNCANNSISDLSNIDSLTSLERLACNGNNLTTINLSSLINLKSLVTSGNPFTAVDLSSLNNLELLIMNYNQLSSIDISALENLKAFSCSFNNLSSIDFTNNLLIEEIFIDSNSLAELNINHLENLSLLSCTDNNIESLEIYSLQNLFLLDISDNLIEFIDCSLTPVRYLNCSDNPNLTFINVQNGVVSTSDPDQLDFPFVFENTPSLEFICLDPGEEDALSYSNYNDSTVIVSNNVCTNSIDELATNKIRIYPNPVKDTFHISSKINIRNIKLFSLNGVELISSNNYQIVKNKIFSLSNGVYFLQFSTQENQTTTFKLIKVSE